MVLPVKSALKFLQLAAVASAVVMASPAWAVTDIMWWHAMSGELGRQLEKLAADFNASQSEYRVVPNAGHFAFLAPCSASLAAMVPDICRDPAGFDRTAFHRELNPAVVTFFKAKLRG